MFIIILNQHLYWTTKISGRKDKKYHVSVIINQTELILIVFITTFSHNIVIYVQQQVWQILLAITEIHYFFDFSYTIRAKCFNFQEKVTGGGGQNVKSTKFCQQLYHRVC